MVHTIWSFVEESVYAWFIWTLLDRCVESISWIDLVRAGADKALQMWIYHHRSVRVYLHRHIPLCAASRMSLHETRQLRRLVKLTENRIGRKMTDLEIVTL